jgi:4a-hydroxytetrahydrobiopterin dehydratase
MSQDLADKQCVPCRAGTPPLTPEQFTPLLEQVPGWEVEAERKLVRGFRFKGWAPAQAFVVAAGDIAEQQGHHPDLTLSWGRVRAEIFTHRIGGLTEADFILAAKLSRLFQQQATPAT